MLDDGPSHPPKGSLAAIADPRTDGWQGLLAAALFFVIFLGWAAFARLDAAAYATGNLVVSGQRQSIQHRDGGVVGSILVGEGQRVQRGQLLVRLAAADVMAQEQVLASQVVRLLAQRSRLEAEQLKQRQVAAPREFATLSADHRKEAVSALQMQQAELQVRLSVLAAQQDALRKRAAQSGEQGRGYVEQVASAREQLRLIDDQIAALAPLAQQGFVSKTRMRELERMKAALLGQRGQYTASVAQAAQASQENQIQVLEADRSFRERTASELREVEMRLSELFPKWQAARDQLARIEIRSPVTGAVVGLSIFTPGGVVSPGQKLMDIVPERQPLRIQLRIAPDDADDLRVGQGVLVKFSGLHERSLPHLNGILTQLSADKFSDERTGQSFFTGEVEVPADQLKLVQRVRGRSFALRPGLPAEVLFPLRKRSALDYAIEPLIGSFWASFREH
jgi:HlyD family type I secretion membrane fusion protein